MKICSGCKQELPLEKFSKRGSGHQSMCKDCQKAYYGRYYRTNPAEKNRLARQRQIRYDEINEFIRGAKDVPCSDCGGRFPYYVMQFDHLGDKLFNIGDSGRLGHSLSKIKAEVAKCEVVCANCHAVRTFTRL